jgi:hypothetical protein
MPLRLPIVRLLETTAFVDDAVPATATLPAKVEVAVVEVAWKLALMFVLLAVEGTTMQVALRANDLETSESEEFSLLGVGPRSNGYANQRREVGWSRWG